MSIKVGQAFERTSAQPIDVTLTLTKADMLTINDNLMPAYYFTICQDDGKIYLYDKTATASVTTGKFKKFDGGSGGGAEIYDTTDTLSPEINGTKVVLAADLPGVSFSDLVVGSSIIKDAKGTLGIVTTITGTTSVTVTTATTSTPTMELTQAQYDALTPAQQNNGTIYFVTDSQPNGGTYMGAYETIYSTTERVIGSYMGKPLYQKTITATWPTIAKTPFYTNVGVSIDAVVDLSTIVYVNSSSNTSIVSGIGGSSQILTDVNGFAKVDVFDNTASANANTIRIQANPNFLSNGSNIEAYATIKYTKTTDTASPVEYASPNDYSTSEKIVGTWIDGKPLYQKTFVGNCSGGNAMTAIATNVKSSLNISEVVDFKGSVNYNNSGGWLPLTYAWVPSNNDYQTAYLSGDGTLYCGGKYSGKTIITIQYTKTTS